MFHGSTRRDVIRRDSARAEDEQERGHRTRVARFCGLATIIIGVTIATVTNGGYDRVSSDRKRVATSSRSRSLDQQNIPVISVGTVS